MGGILKKWNIYLFRVRLNFIYLLRIPFSLGDLIAANYRPGGFRSGYPG
jgi:hypothetical protein